MRKNVVPVVKADKSAQDVGDAEIAANRATDITRKIWAVFKWICQAILKLTKKSASLESDNLIFWSEYFVRTISNAS